MSLRHIAAATTAVTLIAAAPVLARQEAVRLARVAKAGEVTRYGINAQMRMSVNGNDMTVDIRRTSRITVAAVAPNGDITLTSEEESSATMINGQPTPMPPDPSSTLVMRPNGALVSVSSGTPTGSNLEARLHYATTPLFPDRAVKPGDTWTDDIAADAKTGAVAARATVEVLAFEVAEGVPVVKLKLTFAESSGGAPLRAQGTYWIERTTGDAVRAEARIDNLPLGETGGSASLTLVQTRLPSGGR